MSALKDLPFDQFSRQQLVADFIDSLRGTRQSFTILDVGGYKGQTQRFCGKDAITVLDVFSIEEKNYIKGDGADLKLKDNSFDFVVSFDTLEHVPRKKRTAFIQECSRVAKYGFFLCCPFESGSGYATQAEKSLNSIYTDIREAEHRWLEEHIENGLPTQSEIEASIAKGFSFCNTYSNKIENWITLQTLFFLSDALEVVSFKAGSLNRKYNEQLYEVESQASQGNAYRVIYFVSDNKQYVKKVARAMEATKHKGDKNTELLSYLPEGIGEVVGQKLKTQHDTMQHTINVLSEKLAAQERLVEAMRSSVSWQVTKPLRATKYLKKSRGQK